MNVTKPFQMIPTIGRLAAGYGGHLLQDPSGGLKTNALIVSSLILTSSRISSAFSSYKKAPKTAEGKFRKHASIRTIVREALGFTLSFLVLRQIQASTMKQIRKYFGVPQEAGKGLLASIKEAWKSENPGQFATAFEKDRFNFAGFTNHALYEKLEPLINLFSPVSKEAIAHPWKPGFRVPDWLARFTTVQSTTDLLTRAQRLENFHTWAPIVLGSIFSIALSGFALERLSLDYGDSFINLILNRGKPGKQPTPSHVQPSKAPVAKPSFTLAAAPLSAANRESHGVPLTGMSAFGRPNSVNPFTPLFQTTPIPQVPFSYPVFTPYPSVPSAVPTHQ